MPPDDFQIIHCATGRVIAGEARNELYEIFDRTIDTFLENYDGEDD